MLLSRLFLSAWLPFLFLFVILISWLFISVSPSLLPLLFPWLLLLALEEGLEEEAILVGNFVFDKLQDCFWGLKVQDEDALPNFFNSGVLKRLQEVFVLLVEHFDCLYYPWVINCLV